MSAGSLLYVDDDTVASVVGAPHGALVLAKDDCENCAAYEAEIRRLQEQGLLGGLAAGPRRTGGPAQPEHHPGRLARSVSRGARGTQPG